MTELVLEKAGDEVRAGLEQAKDFAAEANEDSEKLSDDTLDSARNSEHTHWILTGTCAAVSLVIGLLIAF
jgi:hypothetical protein